MTASRRIVLLGTGTGVGKTWVGAALVSSWARTLGPAFGQKPLESGIGEGQLPLDESDAAALDRATTAGLRAAEVHRALHAVVLPEPLSPHLAARRAGAQLELEALIEWTLAGETARFERWAGQRGGPVVVRGHEVTPHVTSNRAGQAADGDATQVADGPHGAAALGAVLSLVETAGGACSPMTEAATNLDFARALLGRSEASGGVELLTRVVLVAPDRLGVLHDVAATFHAAAAVGVPIERVVLSAPSAADDSSGSNAAELTRVVFPLLGAAAPRVREVFVAGRGTDDVTELARQLAAD